MMRFSVCLPIVIYKFWFTEHFTCLLRDTELLDV